MECKDIHCPTHGNVRLHGRTFTGIVINAKMQATATIEWHKKKYVPKYERYETKRARIKAHNPPCIDAKPGDIVQIVECRPISRTKHFVVTKILGREELFEAEKELMEEAKVKPKAKPKEALGPELPEQKKLARAALR